MSESGGDRLPFSSLRRLFLADTADRLIFPVREWGILCAKARVRNFHLPEGALLVTMQRAFFEFVT